MLSFCSFDVKAAANLGMGYVHLIISMLVQGCQMSDLRFKTFFASFFLSLATT
jgi:hypothetical protein